MTSLDERIKQELEKEAREIDAMVSEEGGLSTMMVHAYTGGMARWMWLVSAMGFVFALLMFWSLYEFFTATSMEQQVFWGISALLAVSFQTGIKHWSWMEMNRTSLMREIKKLELVLAKMQND